MKPKPDKAEEGENCISCTEDDMWPYLENRELTPEEIRKLEADDAYYERRGNDNQ